MGFAALVLALWLPTETAQAFSESAVGSLIETAAEQETEDFEWINPSSYAAQAFASCWACKIYARIYGAASGYAHAIFNKVANGARALLAAALLVWLGAHMLKQVTSLTPVDPSQFWGPIMARFGWGLAAAAILGMVVAPDGSTRDANDREVNTNYAQLITLTVTPLVSIPVTYVARGCAPSTVSPIDPNNSSGKLLPSEPGAVIGCVIGSMEAIVKKGIALGYKLVITARWFIPKFEIGQMVGGALLILFYGFILVVFPIKLLDAAFAFGIVMTLMPLYVVAAVFPSSRKYLTKARDAFLHSAFTFMFSIITIHVAASLVQGQLAVVPAAGGVDEASEVEKQYSLTGSGFILMVIMCFIAYRLPGTANQLASQFAGSVIQGFMARASAKIWSMIKQAAAAALAVASVIPGVGQAIAGGAKALGAVAGALGSVISKMNQALDRAGGGKKDQAGSAQNNKKQGIQDEAKNQEAESDKAEAREAEEEQDSGGALGGGGDGDDKEEKQEKAKEAEQEQEQEQENNVDKNQERTQHSQEKEAAKNEGGDDDGQKGGDDILKNKGADSEDSGDEDKQQEQEDDESSGESSEDDEAEATTDDDAEGEAEAEAEAENEQAQEEEAAQTKDEAEAEENQPPEEDSAPADNDQETGDAAKDEAPSDEADEGRAEDTDDAAAKADAQGGERHDSQARQSGESGQASAEGAAQDDASQHGETENSPDAASDSAGGDNENDGGLDDDGDGAAARSTGEDQSDDQGGEASDDSNETAATESDDDKATDDDSGDDSDDDSAETGADAADSETDDERGETDSENDAGEEGTDDDAKDADTDTPATEAEGTDSGEESGEDDDGGKRRR